MAGKTELDNSKAKETNLCESGCVYWRPLDGGMGRKACHYLLDTGEKRDSLPGECKRFRTAARASRRKNLVLTDWREVRT